MSGSESCPVCASSEVEVFLRRERVPVHQNLLLATAEAALRVERGNLHMAVCSSCGFVFNAAFDPALLSYGKDYDNSQDWSGCFTAYLDDVVRDLVEKKGVRRSRIVEVGCGKGYFLRRLVASSEGSTGIGFDPSYAGPDTDLGGRVAFRREYYGPAAAQVPADTVVCRHVIEHVERPTELLGAVRDALSGSPAARVFFETPCVEWILRERVLWDFFYEHCSLFSAASLQASFQIAGFDIEQIEHRFGEQYLWIEGRRCVGPGKPCFVPGDIPSLAKDFGRHEASLTSTWLERIRALRRHGRVALWGAGAKGTTFANLIDPDQTLVDCIVDLNPAKQGKYVPGSGHLIVSYQELPTRGVACAILMNPNYRRENEDLLRAASIQAELVE